MLDDRIARVIIEELREARVAFSSASDYFKQAVGQIKWNRRNTVIQYVLTFITSLVLVGGALFYADEQHEECVEDNDLRTTITQALDDHARAIGLALVAVTGSPPDKVDEYMTAYRGQFHPHVLVLEAC